MSGAFSRNKGAGGERAVCALIHDLLGVHVRRKLSQYQATDCDLEVTPDQTYTPAVDWLKALSFQVKRYKRLTDGDIKAAWLQTVSEAQGKAIPCLWYRGDGQSWRVVVPLSMGHDWCSEYDYCQTLTPNGWAFWVREALSTALETVTVGVLSDRIKAERLGGLH